MSKNQATRVSRAEHGANAIGLAIRAVSVRTALRWGAMRSRLLAAERRLLAVLGFACMRVIHGGFERQSDYSPPSPAAPLASVVLRIEEKTFMAPKCEHADFRRQQVAEEEEPAHWKAWPTQIPAAVPAPIRDAEQFNDFISES